MVNDKRWTYDGLLPYFRKTETHHDPNADPHQHGFDGPIHSTPASTRTYPLTAQLKEAYLHVGVKPIPDHNAGDNKGMAPYVENWYKGKRQPAGKAYGLKGVDVIHVTAKRVIFDVSPGGKPKATGVELVSGETITAKKEVIVSCGAIRTPQMLMLSGIGPPSELQKHRIPLVLASPEVGRNFSDHMAITQYYRIHDPEKGLCAPSPAFNHPSYVEGFPTDYIIVEPAPTDLLKKALEQDVASSSNIPIPDTHPHIFPPRSHYEILPMYAPTIVPFQDLDIPLDGSIISIGILNLLPTSRGTITLTSVDPSVDPAIDPNYYATKADHVILRAAVRRNVAAFETPQAQEIVKEEVVPPGYPSLTSRSTDEEIDRRIRRYAMTFFHGCGSASMGTVVDSECRVVGTEGLRVIDASVVPTPVSAHYMVVTYALAEQMAAIIAGVA